MEQEVFYASGPLLTEAQFMAEYAAGVADCFNPKHYLDHLEGKPITTQTAEIAARAKVSH